MKNRFGKTNLIGVLITTLVLVIIVVVSSVNAGSSSVFSQVVSTLFTPIQNGFAHIGYSMSGNPNISDVDKLKEYQNLKDKFSVFTTVPGMVIERSYSNYDKILVINVGAADGIKENMAVACGQGLVGHVIAVNEHTSKVQTIADTANTISANISTSNQSILVKGTIGVTQELKATSIPAEATVMQGDTLTTSGLGGIYPKGILIGTIKEIVNTKNQTDRYATIVPSVNFNTVNTILVITSSTTENKQD